MLRNITTALDNIQPSIPYEEQIKNKQLLEEKELEINKLKNELSHIKNENWQLI